MLSIEKEKKKNKERKMMIKLKYSYLVFLTLLKVSGTDRVDLATRQQRDLVCSKLFELLCFVFLGAAPIPLCTGGHFEPAPFLLKKYYCIS